MQTVIRFRAFIRFGAFILCCAAGCRASEPVCFRTPADAVGQTGVRGVAGYRLESSNLDIYSGMVWAVVKSCEHPERPGLVVFSDSGQVAAALRHIEAQPAHPMLLQAGARVQVVIHDGLAQLQIPGIAQASAADGDAVRVRLVPASQEQGTVQFATGILRGNGIVEVVTR